MDVLCTARPILHIVLIGFHHKKGSQVEFAYPPLLPALPPEWQALPHLALPDGAHNYQEDCVYFHLPPRTGHKGTVFGVACYRQIDTQKLKVRGADMTRGTVQKSIALLSCLPLYGFLQAKLQMITQVFFQEKDFSHMDMLKELFEQLNTSLAFTHLNPSFMYVGLSARKLLLHFGHMTLMLFKLVLLEKRVLFFLTPVHSLVGTIMALLSLFPGMIEHGLEECMTFRPHGESMDEVPVSLHSWDPGLSSHQTAVQKLLPHTHSMDPYDISYHISSMADGSDQDSQIASLPPRSAQLHARVMKGADRIDIAGLAVGGFPVVVQPFADFEDDQERLASNPLSGLKEDVYGMPLAIFTKGYACLPYLSLQQHILLGETSLRGFIVGATNFLFRRQKHLTDVAVDVESCQLEFHDDSLSPLLELTTADLRFISFLVQHVGEAAEGDIASTSWEGSEDWLRAQFRLYLLSLLTTTLESDNEVLLSDYGSAFVQAWQNTHNYRVWNIARRTALHGIQAGHPFQGNYSVADVKLRLAHSMQRSESGRKLGSAIANTSRSVMQTGRAVGHSVGGVLSGASTTFSSLLSYLISSSGPCLPQLPDDDN
uniref:late secretory pathway protein AVL9 homolog isoform X1 n=1 Tax=Myxine glutinosa TaxID=7769 RepID=UPI00358EEB13